VKLNAVPVSTVEDGDTVLDVVDAASLPEQEVVRLRSAVVAGQPEEALTADNVDGAAAERGPLDGVGNPVANFLSFFAKKIRDFEN
jgi:hypothetical protein